MPRISPLPLRTVPLLLLLSGSLAAQTPPTAAQKAEVAARISAAELDTANSAPNTALFPAPRKFNHDHKISSTFDRFKNRTEVMAEVISKGLFKNASSPFKVAAVFGFAGKELFAPPRFVLLGFGSQYPFDWKYLKDHSVNLLVDDTLAIDGGETLWDGDVSAGSRTDGPLTTHEVITALLPIESFLRIVNGKKVEARVGSTVIQFKEDQLETLRDLASRMMPNRRTP